LWIALFDDALPAMPFATTMKLAKKNEFVPGHLNVSLQVWLLQR
jgi:hypothetical protein